MNEIPYEWGTAVNVQQMAFGNSGDRSGTGVAFTRNPATGEKKLMGEYLINAQGEDVVAGVRTPFPISHLEEQMPEVYNQFIEVAGRLEAYYRDMQDMPRFAFRSWMARPNCPPGPAAKLYCRATACQMGTLAGQAARLPGTKLIAPGILAKLKTGICIAAAE